MLTTVGLVRCLVLDSQLTSRVDEIPTVVGWAVVVVGVVVGVVAGDMEVLARVRLAESGLKG